MRILNPNYVDPMEAQIETYRQHFIDYCNGLPTDKQFITPDEIRAHFNKTPAQFPDGRIEMILRAIGVEED